MIYSDDRVDRIQDPDDCKICPEWDDSPGECRLPARNRTCGQRRPHRPEVIEPPYDLYDGSAN